MPYPLVNPYHFELNNCGDCLKPGISFEILDKLAHQIGDKQAKVIYGLQNIACGGAADSCCSGGLRVTGWAASQTLV